MHTPTVRCTHFPDARSQPDDFSAVMFSAGAAAIAAAPPAPPVPLVVVGGACRGLHTQVTLCTLSRHGERFHRGRL